MCKIFRKLFHKDKPKPTPAPTPAPTPEPEIDILAGKAKRGVSFFDAMRATIPGQLDDDMQYLVDLGIDIIRIFINFDLYNFREIDNDHKIMFDGAGNLDPAKLNMLHLVLQKAHERKLIVDVSFISHPVGLSETALRNGFIKTVIQIKEWGYKNIIFDLANEHHEISEATCIQLAKDMRNIAGNDYYYGISGGYTPEDSCDLQVRQEGCNMVRYHDPRVANFYTDVVDLGNRLLTCAGNRPCYFDEPTRAGWGNVYPTADQWVTYFTHLKNLGVHGCLHTEAGFVMHKKSFRSQLRPEEKQAIERIGKL